MIKQRIRMEEGKHKVGRWLDHLGPSVACLEEEQCSRGRGLYTASIHCSDDYHYHQVSVGDWWLMEEGDIEENQAAEFGVANKPPCEHVNWLVEGHVLHRGNRMDGRCGLPSLRLLRNVLRESKQKIRLKSRTKGKEGGMRGKPQKRGGKEPYISSPYLSLIHIHPAKQLGSSSIVYAVSLVFCATIPHHSTFTILSHHTFQAYFNLKREWLSCMWEARAEPPHAS